jgi:hypothetical protein
MVKFALVRLWFVFLFFLYFSLVSLNSVVGIATGYGLDDRGVGVRVPVVPRIFTTPYSPDRLSGPPNGYRGPFPRC